MKLKASEIRSGFIDFFRQRAHTFVPSSPVVPAGDETLLFANAGMNQFKDVFLGLARSDWPRAVSSQKCIRVSGKHNDLEQVGVDTYHHTFFEMLGNWSFDDYFKAEAIEWAWQLLTRVWGIAPDRLWATVFAGDDKEELTPDREAAELWMKVTSIPAERVLSFGKKDNFWEMGETGPCGPCSEIHIDLGPQCCDRKHQPGHSCGVNGGCGRFIELWNLVFIQYNRRQDGHLGALGARYVDTGAGLERLAAVLQQVEGNYDSDLFRPIIAATEQLAGRSYTGRLDCDADVAFRVIADHVRAVVFAITDGAMPSNEGRGYVVRRILRRAARFGRVLGMHEPFIFRLVPVLGEVMGEAFPDVKQQAEHVGRVIESEEAAFGRTLDRGIEIFNAAAQRAEGTKERAISGEEAFGLYDTYGFPLDLTELMARERNLSVDAVRFAELMEQQRQRARSAQKATSLAVELAGVELPAVDDSPKYETDSCVSRVIGFVKNGQFKTQGRVTSGAEHVGLVLESTCFYAEAGGQAGDSGLIRSETGAFVVRTTERVAECVLHNGWVEHGRLAVGDEVLLRVSTRRQHSKKNHTATHLLQWALRQVLGKSVRQQGSLVGPDYLRFDFTWPAALTEEQLNEVEDLVRQKIKANLPVTFAVLPRQQAEKLGAMAFFGEKYGSQVRVVAIGAASESQLTEAFSKEFCGGTHCSNTGQIGDFKIIKEESISAGVRRITALTGEGLNRLLRQRSDIVDRLEAVLAVPADELAERVERLVEDNKRLSKQLKSGRREQAGGISTEAEALLDGCEKIGPTSVIIGRLLSQTSAEQVRSVIDMLKKKAKSAVVVLGIVEVDKATVLAGVTDDVVKAGLTACDIVKAVGSIIEGGGGGRANIAQAGGKNPEKIDEALTRAAEIVKERLAGAN
jgi:alanyl-tRNA synthetase